MSQIQRLQKQTFLVVDDHALVLDGTLGILRQAYPEADILTGADGSGSVKPDGADSPRSGDGGSGDARRDR